MVCRQKNKNKKKLAKQYKPHSVFETDIGLTRGYLENLNRKDAKICLLSYLNLTEHF